MSRLKALGTWGYSWFSLLWATLSVCTRFWRWRIQLWFQRSGTAESTTNSMKRTMLIIRHGQTTWNVEHRLPGQLPGVALNENGRKQAARLAEVLTALPISSLISSPLERARDTAEFIARGRNLPIQLEPDLVDTDIGSWAGQIIDELSKKDPAWRAYVKDPTVAPEGVETFPQVQQRVLIAVERWLAREESGAYPAFVAHADVVKLLIAHYMGIEAKRAGALTIDNASVSLIELEQEKRPRVLAIGWSPHPGWLKPPALTMAQPTEQQQEQHAGEQKT